MSIYNINGQTISSAYNCGGHALQNAYDISGNIIMTSEFPLTVMSFNVQRWTGLNNNNALMTSIFDKYDADVVGWQEFATTKDNFLRTWWQYQTDPSATPAKNSLCAKYPLTDAQSITFMTQTGEQRGYKKAHITVNGKTIALYASHLHYSYDADSTANATRKGQAQELIADMLLEDYAILMVDTNANVLNHTDGAWTDFGKLFGDAGFNMANWTDNGFLYTCADDTAATQWESIDNIIVSSNISITEVIVDQTKVEQASGAFIDHLPLIADLVVY